MAKKDSGSLDVFSDEFIRGNWIPERMRRNNFFWLRVTVFSGLFFFIPLQDLTNILHLPVWVALVVSFFGAGTNALFSGGTVYWRILPDNPHYLPTLRDGAGYFEEDSDAYFREWLRRFMHCQEPLIMALSYTFFSFFFSATVAWIAAGSFAPAFGFAVKQLIYMLIVTVPLAFVFVLRADRELDRLDAEYEKARQFSELTQTFLQGKMVETTQLMRTVGAHIEKENEA